jgi:hypothetical protein
MQDGVREWSSCEHVDPEMDTLLHACRDRELGRKVERRFLRKGRVAQSQAESQTDCEAERVAPRPGIAH